ncbi:MAG: hypothetical protein WD066_14020 [Planctomycetaceae bacterium]
MYRLATLLLAAAVGGAFMYFALQYHLVRTDDGFFVVPKRDVALTEIYVDVRDWSPLDWERRPALVEALIRHGRGDLIRTETGRSLFRGVLERFELPGGDRGRHR